MKFLLIIFLAFINQEIFPKTFFISLPDTLKREATETTTKERIPQEDQSSDSDADFLNSIWGSFSSDDDNSSPSLRSGTKAKIPQFSFTPKIGIFGGFFSEIYMKSIRFA